jgi:hypothetical protein
VSSSRFLDALIEAESDIALLSFARAAIFQVYTACLSTESVPGELSVNLPIGDKAGTVSLTPFVARTEALGALVKSLFSSDAANTLQVLPCRLENKVGSGIGLMVFVDNEPTMTIGSRADGGGLFLRQIDVASRPIYGALEFRSEVGQRYARVVPLETALFRSRKPK